MNEQVVSTLGNIMRTLAAAIALAALHGCGGAGGGDAAPGVQPGPPPANQPPPPPPTPSPGGASFGAAESLITFVTGLEVPADGRPLVTFSVADENNLAITDLTASNVRFALAKWTASTLGTSQGEWQSYINSVEQPGVGPGTEAKLQATAERATNGELTNNGDGTYTYRFAQDITNLPQDVLDQAALEGLDLSYDDTQTHRVALQYGGGKQANPYLDVQPSTGVSTGIPTGRIVATANCNGCHNPLALHGGGRVEVEYCVQCHNPGSTDANSGNSVNFKEMIHKIHYGADLPSVQAGGTYEIYGFQDRVHDYSELHYPGDVRNCTQCHAGTNTDVGLTNEITPAGDNWNEYPTRVACGSCHDDLDFTTHFGGQLDDSDCRSCHSSGGLAGSPAETHVDPVAAAAQRYRFDILSVTGTAQGETPVIDFRIVDPTNGDAPWDILGDAPFLVGFGASRIAVTVGWSTTDYTNTGNGNDLASTVSINALTQAVAVGGGVFRVTSPVAIPDGTLAPFVAATGSGAVTIEGHPAETIDGNVERIPVTNSIAYFSIDEASGVPVPRRQVAELDQCLVCHGSLSIHGANRTDNLETCVTCHNPRNSDRLVRGIALTAPTDGKQEQSIDFKVMVHAIHAASYRENPIQIVGFGGFTTYVFDEAQVHYPGELSDCTTCHAGDSYALPLAAGVLGTTVDSGADLKDPADDIVASPTAAVCASCHDSAAAITHIENEGGDFATTQAFLDGGVTVELCASCHGPGNLADVRIAHGLE